MSASTRTLLGVLLLVAALTIAMVNAADDSPYECPYCGRLVPPDDYDEHCRQHERDEQ